MRTHTVQVEKTSGDLQPKEQLAWKIAHLASESAKPHSQSLEPDVEDMVRNRIIDNAAIAIAAINETPVVVARTKALHSEGSGGATIYGLSSERRFSPEKAAFANAVAVRYLDQDDTYLAAEYSHPDDNISPLLAVAQHKNVTGLDLIRGIAIAYEVQVALVGTGNGTGISLHEYKVDHMTHIAAATASGLGSMLKLPTEQIYHAINFAVHNSISSRQSRKGKIGSQKEFVPGYSAEIAIDAVNNAMQGLMGPNPVYEGVDSIISRFLAGPESEYTVQLAEPDKDRLRNIMITYPKEHSFEYQGQAIIDLAMQLRPEVFQNGGLEEINTIELRTSHHTHHVIGTGANDPEKIDLRSPRGTLDHSIMFAIARTLEQGEWHHERSYQDLKDNKCLSGLIKKIVTTFDQQWEDRYHSTDPSIQAFGGEIHITFRNGAVVKREKAVANAHVYGITPWGRKDYIKKFTDLTDNLVSKSEQIRLIGTVKSLGNPKEESLHGLTAIADLNPLVNARSQGLY